MIYESAELLQKDLEYWTRILRLQDWDIEATIRRARELDYENTAATVAWTFENKQAVIKLLDPVDYMPGLMEDQDHEVSLVHELLHLHYAGFDETERGSLAHAMLEQSINAISNALVWLRRQGVKNLGTEERNSTIR